MKPRHVAFVFVFLLVLPALGQPGSGYKSASTPFRGCGALVQGVPEFCIMFVPDAGGSYHVQYLGATQTIELIAKPDYVTMVVEEGRPTPMTAKKFRWNLDKDRIEIEQPGTGRVPVR